MQSQKLTSSIYYEYGLACILRVPCFPALLVPRVVPQMQTKKATAEICTVKSRVSRVTLATLHSMSSSSTPCVWVYV